MEWDAEAAGGDPSPVEAMLAWDGVDEWATWMADPEDLAAVAPVTVRLVASDLKVERFLAVRPDGTLAHDAAGGVDATIEAPASDLDLLVWRRISSRDVVIDGDGAAVESFLNASDLT